MTTDSSLAPGGRILWMDAMRGFSIILVVLGHVLLGMGLGDDKTVLSSLLITFRMPLFFFVSGFFSYRSRGWWTRGRLRDILTRKFTAQILGAIIFFSIYSFVFTRRVDFSGGLDRYWFTIALFQMYVVYVAVVLCCRRFRPGVGIAAILVVGLLFEVANLTMPVWLMMKVRFLECYKVTYYMQFFALGIACSHYRERFFRVLASGRFATAVIVAAVVFLLLWRGLVMGLLPDRGDVAYYVVKNVAMRYLGLAVVLMMFYGMAGYWNRDTRLTRFMTYTGRRTLDIYYIHYFFVPRILYVRAFLLGNDRFVLQLLAAGIVTAMVVAMSLMVSSILRRSPLLRTFLLGQRPERRRAAT